MPDDLSIVAEALRLLGTVVPLLGLVASIYLLLLLLALGLALAITAFVALKLVGAFRRWMAGFLAKAQDAAGRLERGTMGSARAAVAPLVAGRRVSATARALWRRTAGAVRASRGAG